MDANECKNSWVKIYCNTKKLDDFKLWIYKLRLNFGEHYVKHVTIHRHNWINWHWISPDMMRCKTQNIACTSCSLKVSPEPSHEETIRPMQILGHFTREWFKTPQKYLHHKKEKKKKRKVAVWERMF